MKYQAQSCKDLGVLPPIRLKEDGDTTRAHAQDLPWTMVVRGSGWLAMTRDRLIVPVESMPSEIWLAEPDFARR